MYAIVSRVLRLERPAYVVTNAYPWESAAPGEVHLAPTVCVISRHYMYTVLHHIRPCYCVVILLVYVCVSGLFAAGVVGVVVGGMGTVASPAPCPDS